ncbi:hypothetical protein ACWEJ6_48275 [Nonomuraea sp. NPDC004702]
MGANEQDPEIPDPQVRERATARRSTAGEGAMPCREGLYSSLISSWRTARDHGIAADMLDLENAFARP